MRLERNASARFILAFLMAVLLVFPATGALLAQECTRVAGQWYCRACHKYHPNAMVICPYNPEARLQVQKQRFRELLQPSFSASKLTVTAGEPVELRWYSYCATKVRIEPEVGEVRSSGMIRVRPLKTTQYTLVLETEWADWQTPPSPQPVEVRPAPPKAQLHAAPLHIFPNDTVNLRWQTQFADRVRIESLSGTPPLGAEKPNGALTIGSLSQSTTFRLTAEVDGLPPAISEVSVEVRPLPTVPTPDSGPDMTGVFAGAAPIFRFGNKLPKLPPPGAARFSYNTPPAEEAKLYNFIRFLQQYPTLHLKVTGRASEFAGQRDQAVRLANNRRTVAYQSLLNGGIAADRISLGDPVLEPNSRQDDARAVVFSFNGMTPEAEVQAVPARVTAGEPVMLVWKTRYADMVILPNGKKASPQGVERLVPSSSGSLSVVAMNTFGLLNTSEAKVFVDPPTPPPPPPSPPSPVALVAENMPEVFFSSGSADLDAFSRSALDSAATWLLQPSSSKLRVAVSGYCAYGEKARIAQERADAVAQYLQAHGVNQDRFVAQPGRPSELNDASQWHTRPAEQAADRRVRFAYRQQSTVVPTRNGHAILPGCGEAGR